MADAQAAAGVGRKEDAHAATAKRVQAADAYMRLLQHIFEERRKLAHGDSTLMSHERDAIVRMNQTVRSYACLYGGGAGLAVGGVMRALNPQAFHSRRFWAWTIPSVAWGAIQGLQAGGRVSVVEIMNLPDSPFAQRLVGHLKEHVPESPLLAGVQQAEEWQKDKFTTAARQENAERGQRGGAPVSGQMAEFPSMTAAIASKSATLDDRAVTSSSSSSSSPPSRPWEGSRGAVSMERGGGEAARAGLSSAVTAADERGLEGASHEQQLVGADGGEHRGAVGVGGGGDFFSQIYPDWGDSDGARKGSAALHDPREADHSLGTDARARRRAMRLELKADRDTQDNERGPAAEAAPLRRQAMDTRRSMQG